MARSIWNGTITLGPLEVPVKTYSATEDRTIHFHQVHLADGARIKQKRICVEEGIEVPYDEVAKGYPVDDGEYVLVSSEEITAITAERARVIELEQFTPLEQIDPAYFDHSYYLGSGTGSGQAYRTLHQALGKSGRAGIGRWVFHNREYLVAIRPLERMLAMQTMRFAAELVAPSSLGIPQASKPPTQAEVKMASMLVETLYADFDPGQFTDTYRERVLALIERKAAGTQVEVPEAPVPAPAPDLMSALQASLDAASEGKGRRRRAPATGGARGGQRASTTQSKPTDRSR